MMAEILLFFGYILLFMLFMGGFFSRGKGGLESTHPGLYHDSKKLLQRYDSFQIYKSKGKLLFIGKDKDEITYTTLKSNTKL